MSTATMTTLEYRGGSAIKAASPGRLTGLLVSFRTPDGTRQRDWFDEATDFGRYIKGEIDVLVHHGLDEAIGDEVIGVATIRPEAEGLAIDAEIDDHSRGGADAMTVARAGGGGWSSGAVGHLVRRVKQPDGTHWLKKWPIAEASVTPRPCDRHAVLRVAGIEGKSAPPVGGSATISNLAALIRAGHWPVDPAEQARRDRHLAEARATLRLSEARQMRESIRSARRTLRESEREQTRRVLEWYAAINAAARA